ncbi:ribose-phosphate diphosphokinase [Nocardia pseudobrasiliensis]|uniref:ribose-phosphate diphosphokinase n=1 Tax=Nocardia pseudobrasiliensis TaxID=45979 RepID=A0A370IC54_9NOCA|nr:ribose-phosphate pyrophosphokinase [Nocardia pseudobrasiliensis]RDI68283.1 ribose-phosphate pyrophosphokinase [Nocardia pseudobrasiliensis]
MDSLRIIAGSANPRLADAVGAQLGIGSRSAGLERYPDGEVLPLVDDVAGEDVYIVQPTSPPVAEHLVELLLLIDACRRARADRVTAVVPYFGYARQDRRFGAGASVGAKVVGEAIAHAGADRLIVVDPHTPNLEAICPVPVELVSAVPLLAHTLAPALSERTVVVAPDPGAVERCEQFASVMRCSIAIVRKHRESGTRVSALELLGSVDERPVAIVDDMIATGATLEAATRLLRYHAHSLVAAATHGPLTSGATSRLQAVGIHRIVVTDTVAQREPSPVLEICSIAPLLAEVIARLHGAMRIPHAAATHLDGFAHGS